MPQPVRTQVEAPKYASTIGSGQAYSDFPHTDSFFVELENTPSKESDEPDHSRLQRMPVENNTLMTKDLIRSSDSATVIHSLGSGSSLLQLLRHGSVC